MKTLLVIFSFVMLTLTLNAQLNGIPKKEIPEAYGYIVKIGQQAPDFTMQLTDGTSVTLSDLKGKVVMLQFTASWCSVCRKEMPHIENDIWLKNKDNKDFTLFGIDLDEPLDKVKKFKSDIDITYPLALDPNGEIFYSFAAQKAGVTRNIIIDKTGKIVYMTRLFNLDEFNEMKAVIEYLLRS